MMLKPTSDTFACPRCGGACELRPVSDYAPRIVQWFCTKDETHRFLPGVERLFTQKKSG
jgi:hypothetical protein